MGQENPAKGAAEMAAKERVKQTRESNLVDAAKGAAVFVTPRSLSHGVHVCQSNAPLSELHECIRRWCSAIQILVIGREMIKGVCSVCYDKYFKEQQWKSRRRRRTLRGRAGWILRPTGSPASLCELVRFDDDGGLPPQIDCSFIFVLIGPIFIDLNDRNLIV